MDPTPGPAHLAETLHGGLQVQKHVLHRPEDLVHGEAGDGGPQLRLHPLIQERTLVLEGRLQQGAEGTGRGTLWGKAARRRRRLGEEDRPVTTGGEGAGPGEQVRGTFLTRGHLTAPTRPENVTRWHVSTQALVGCHVDLPKLHSCEGLR